MEHDANIAYDARYERARALKKLDGMTYGEAVDIIVRLEREKVELTQQLEQALQKQPEISADTTILATIKQKMNTITNKQLFNRIDFLMDHEENCTCDYYYSKPKSSMNSTSNWAPNIQSKTRHLRANWTVDRQDLDDFCSKIDHQDLVNFYSKAVTDLDINSMYSIPITPNIDKVTLQPTEPNADVAYDRAMKGVV